MNKKELKAEWDAKVPLVKGRFANPYRGHNPVSREAKVTYYRMLGKAWWEERDWQREEKEIMWYASEGMPISEICTQMFPKHNKSYIRHKLAKIIRKYEAKWKIVSK